MRNIHPCFNKVHSQVNIFHFLLAIEKSGQQSSMHCCQADYNRAGGCLFASWERGKQIKDYLVKKAL